MTNGTEQKIAVKTICLYVYYYIAYYVSDFLQIYQANVRLDLVAEGSRYSLI